MNSVENQIELGIDDRRNDVGKSRPGRHHTYAELLRYPCIGVGGVSGGRLVAAIDQVQRHLCAMKQESFKMTAVKREYIGDTGLLQRAGEQFTSGYRSG